MEYITEEILHHFKKDYLKTLKTKEDITKAYFCTLAPCLCDNPSDVYYYTDSERAKKIIEDLWETLKDDTLL